ncbi:MAG TPA: hypothetical protein VGZ48_14090 [Candidatus Acidoferrales bacterium]|jgi:hypothetical protein|nr:hypothetical protein [Candidatus Acidoferrales bacterium]
MIGKPATTLKSLIQMGQVCKCLRAKTLFYDVEEIEASQENNPHYYAAYSGLNGPFWCVNTQGLQGPDGKIASLEACRGGSGRSCCETA